MKNRDMFYQNLNQGYAQPGMGAQSGMYVPPSGYNINSQYQAYGPNVLPEQMNNYYDNDLESRISKLERQIKSLDIKVQKLESASVEVIEDNVYMI